MSDSSPVKVCMYDLSHGMMAAMSPQLLGRQFEGLWHTSVVVYGMEYFFGGGIQEAPPGTTAAGQPLRTLDYGTTEVPREMFEEYLRSLKDRFNVNTYHLLNNNCNHFSQEAVSFLTGRSLPDTVVNLPGEFASTPFGAMMVPMINQMFAQLGGSGAPV